MNEDCKNCAVNTTKDTMELEVQILKLEGRVLSEVQGIKSDISTMKEDIKGLVTIERFNPVSYIAYGLAGGVLTTALGAVLSKVFL